MTIIALTGATGHLGGHVVDELIARGADPADLVAIVRDRAKAAPLAERGLTVRVADYSSPAGWDEALAGVDRLLLISVSGAGAENAHRVVIDAASRAGVGLLAYTSILNADTTHNPLAPAHLATEKLIEASGVPAVILRNAWYHEFYTRLLPDYLAAGAALNACCDGRISGAARADLAAAAAAVLLDESVEPGILELGSPSFTLDDVLSAASAASGRTIVNRSVSPEEYTDALTAQGMGAWAGLQVDNDRSIAAGEMFTDSDALVGLVGRPLITLEESFRAAYGALN